MEDGEWRQYSASEYVKRVFFVFFVFLIFVLFFFLGLARTFLGLNIIQRRGDRVQRENYCEKLIKEVSIKRVKEEGAPQ